jgi:hypothetical protein
VSQATEWPFSPSCAAQAAAKEVLPSPAGAFITPTRLPGSSDRMARSRGRATSPAGRAGTILVARNGSRLVLTVALRGPAPIAKCLERGSIKGSPYTRPSLPHLGGTLNGRVVRSLMATEGQRLLGADASIPRSPRRPAWGLPRMPRVERRQKSRTTNRAYLSLRSFGRYDLIRQSGLAHKADRPNESHRANVRQSHAEL